MHHGVSTGQPTHCGLGAGCAARPPGGMRYSRAAGVEAADLARAALGRAAVPSQRHARRCSIRCARTMPNADKLAESIDPLEIWELAQGELVEAENRLVRKPPL